MSPTYHSTSLITAHETGSFCHYNLNSLVHRDSKYNCTIQTYQSISKKTDIKKKEKKLTLDLTHLQQESCRSCPVAHCSNLIQKHGSPYKYICVPRNCCRPAAEEDFFHIQRKPDRAEVSWCPSRLVECEGLVGMSMDENCCHGEVVNQCQRNK